MQVSQRFEEEACESHQEIEESEEGDSRRRKTRACQNPLEKHDCHSRDDWINCGSVQWQDLQSGKILI